MKGSRVKVHGSRLERKEGSRIQGAEGSSGEKNGLEDSK